MVIDLNTFDNLQAEVMRLHERQDFGAIIELLAQHGSGFPEHERGILFWKSVFNSLAGNTEAALMALEIALDSGYWYYESWLRDEDFQTLQGNPAFEQLVALSTQRMHEFAAQTIPTHIDFSPKQGQTTIHRLLIALHGNNSTAQLESHWWQPASQYGWHVCLPLSTQPGRGDTAVWNDNAWVLRDVKHNLDALTMNDSIHSAQVVIGGFSMGARQALTLGLSGVISAAGVIAVAPALGDGIDHLQPHLDVAKACNLRVCLVIGDRDDPDYAVGPTIALSDVLNKHGIPCKLYHYQELGHDYPRDFAELLEKMLIWIAEENA